MIGAIIGDIVGSTREFNNTFEYNFELFPKGSEFTDDTVCTVAVADAILKGKPYKDSLVEWCRKYPHPMGGYGASFSFWVRQPVPYDSFGNGAAMRISPVGWAFDEDAVFEEARKATECSHSHEEGIKGAAVIAKTIAMLRSGVWHKEHVEAFAKAVYGSDAFKNIPRPGVWNETCQGCVPLAMFIFAGSEGFEDAIRCAISYGGDSDTLGAIVGGLAGAFYRIPDEMRRKAIRILPKEMRQVVYQFESRYC